MNHEIQEKIALLNYLEHDKYFKVIIRKDHELVRLLN